MVRKRDICRSNLRTSRYHKSQMEVLWFIKQHIYTYLTPWDKFTLWQASSRILGNVIKMTDDQEARMVNYYMSTKEFDKELRHYVTMIAYCPNWTKRIDMVDQFRTYLHYKTTYEAWLKRKKRNEGREHRLQTVCTTADGWTTTVWRRDIKRY